MPPDLSNPAAIPPWTTTTSPMSSFSVGVSLDPSGDLIECDVARETASSLLEALDDLGLAETGGIVVTIPSSTPFRRPARRPGRLRPPPGRRGDLGDRDCQWLRGEPAHMSFRRSSGPGPVRRPCCDHRSSVLVVGARWSVGVQRGGRACTASFRQWGLPVRSVRLLEGGFAFDHPVVTRPGVVGPAGLSDSDAAAGQPTGQLHRRPTSGRSSCPVPARREYSPFRRTRRPSGVGVPSP